ncbi:MAG TPA: class I SAM-dependent methyltransferase [Cellvibrionaceae bacterium]
MRCLHCALVFVPPTLFLNSAEEKAEYDLHDNHPEDPGYRKFLSRIAEPLLARLPTEGAKGLDFGCGPGPALASMLEEAGCRVALYDIFYYPDQRVLNQHYDFITATEVFEHLHQPAAVINRLWQCLVPGGCLAIMTKLVVDREAFSGWHYKNDPTHVIFFSRETFSWLAHKLDARIEFVGNDVIMLTRAGAK